MKHLARREPGLPGRLRGPRGGGKEGTRHLLVPQVSSKDLGANSSLQHACHLRGPQRCQPRTPPTTEHREGHGQTGEESFPLRHHCMSTWDKDEAKKEALASHSQSGAMYAPSAEECNPAALHRTALKLVLKAL